MSGWVLGAASRPSPADGCGWLQAGLFSQPQAAEIAARLARSCKAPSFFLHARLPKKKILVWSRSTPPAPFGGKRSWKGAKSWDKIHAEGEEGTPAPRLLRLLPTRPFYPSLLQPSKSEELRGDAGRASPERGLG